MKTLSSCPTPTRSLAAISFAALVLTLIPTSSVMAVERDNQFCRTIDTKQAAILSRLDDRIEKVEERLDARDTKLDEHFVTIDTRRATNRSTWEDNRDDRYVKILALADTDAEKQAVALYETVLEAAVKTRQSAVDAAVTTFRSGLDQSVKKRETGVTTAMDHFRTSTEAAFEKAKAGCAGDAVNLAVRSDFRSDLRAAKDQLKSDINALDKIRTDRSSLASARQSAIEAAVKTFESEAEAAREILKNAFGK